MVKLPKFYNPDRIGTLFYPDVTAISKEAEKSGLSPSETDKNKILLMIIDMQVDFSHEKGTLYTPGALEDIKRLTEFIFRHAERISHITCSLDSHYPYQIFHAAWWRDKKGNHPDPMTIITVDDVESGKWIPILQPQWSKEYVKKLAENAQKELTIWPYHVPIGGVGNILDPELWSVVFWHSLARKSQPTWWMKGSIAKTEHYSMLKPEIEVPEAAKGTINPDFIESLESYDHIVIAGEAESHCVLETAEDLVETFSDQPQQLKKIYILRDCMSPVEHPDIDFDKIAKEKFEQLEDKGLQLINSTDELPF